MDKKETQKLIQQNKKVYNLIASHFSDTRSYLWEDLKPLRKYTRNNDCVLDLACGNGRLYQLFQGLSITYIGLDQSEELIKIARQKVPDGVFILADMIKLPFKDANFDIIYCIAAFQHIPTKELRLQTLREMKRALRPGGLVVMTNWNLLSKEVGRNLAKWKLLEARTYEKNHSPSLGVSEPANYEQNEINVLVPWKDALGNILGERYYHGFTIQELEKLFLEIGFEVKEQYYTSKGKRSSMEEPGNIISILQSP